MAIKDRLIQITLKARNLFSGEVEKSSSAVAALREQADQLKRTLEDDNRAKGLARNLRDTRAATADIERAWRDAEASLADLTREIGDSERATAGQRIALREARKTAEDAERAYKRNQTAIRNLTGELTSLGVNTKNLSAEEQRLVEAVDKGKAALADTRAEMRRVTAAEKDAAKAAEEHRNRVDSVRQAMASGVRQAAGYVAAFVGINAVLGLASRGIELLRGGIVEMLQTGDQFENLENRLTALMGSVAGGEQAAAWIKTFAKDTPLQLSDVTDAFSLLKAYGVDPMNGSLQSIEDMSEKLGGGMERLEGIVTAVGQAWAKEKLQTEEILQLVERGVPVWDMLAKVTGKTTVQLQDLASKGKLGRDVIKALVDEMGRSSEGAAAKAMGTLTGLVSNLGDTATDFLDRIAKSGALDFVKGKLKDLSNTIAEMDADGRLDRLAKGLSNAFVQGYEKLEEFAKELVKVDFKKLTDDSTAWLNSFKSNVNSAVSQINLVFAPVRAGFNLLTLAASGVAAAVTGIFSKTFGIVATMAKAVPEALGGDELSKTFESVSKKLGSIASTAAAQVKQDAADLKTTWTNLSADAEQSTKQQAESAQASVEKSTAAAVDAAEVVNQTLLKLAEEGKLRIGSLASAMELIASTKTTQQLEALRAALLKAMQDGALSQEQFAQATGLLNTRIKELGTGAAAATSAAAETSAKSVETANDALLRLINEGKVGLADLAQALDLINTAKSQEQLEQFRKALLKAFQAGKLSQEDYANSTGVLNAKLGELKKATSSAAEGVSDLSAGLENLKEVQAAISNAKTSVDIQNIRTALNKLYNDGTISAKDFNREQESLAKKVQELKASGATGAEGMDQLAESTDKATKSLEEQRKEMGEAMEAHRKGLDDNKEVTEGAFDFFGDQLAAARQPLAELSDEALRLFDSLQGLSSTELKLDTSSVESTEKSLEQVRQSLTDIGSLTEVGMGGFGRWAVSLRRNSLEMQEATLEQKKSLLELLDEVDRGDTNLQNFLTRATAARNSLGYLNDSDLRQLEGAIDSARQRMQQLQEGSKQTLTNLQEELAGLRGEQEALDRSKFASRKADLQKQITDAQASGDNNALQNLMRAWSTLGQIESETNRQREQAAQEKLVEERNKAAPAAEPAAAAPPTTRVIRFETPQGAKEVTVASEADETNLLGVLEQFRGRTG